MKFYLIIYTYLRVLFHRFWFGVLNDRLSVHQNRQLAKLGRHLMTFPPYKGIKPKAFSIWPKSDKAAMMKRFEDYNQSNLGFDDIQALIKAGRTQWQGYRIGQSTGTSGNRGVYIIYDRESYLWLGTILAKTIPMALFRSVKVALALVSITGLYQATQKTKKIQFQGFALGDGLDLALDGISAMNPDVIIAPPRVLVALSDRMDLKGKTLFSAGEVLEPNDRALIESKSQSVLREIYMATEGLLGVSCKKGVMHLCEDVMKFEYEDYEGSSTIKRLVITDFTRRAQAIVHYQLNDCVILEQKPCSCGSPYQGITQILGRADDLIRAIDKKGSVVTITPDLIRNCVIDTDNRIQDFEVIEISPSQLIVRLEARFCHTHEEIIKNQFQNLSETQALGPFSIKIEPLRPLGDGQKRRRIRREDSVKTAASS